MEMEEGPLLILGLAGMVGNLWSYPSAVGEERQQRAAFAFGVA